MIADLHCHYPMHLLPGEREPGGPRANWQERLRDVLQADVEGWLARVANDRNWLSGWRVDLEGLQRGGARIVFSVLYWPPAEFDFSKKYGSPPLAVYFEDIKYQLKRVAGRAGGTQREGHELVIAKQRADLDSKGIVFVHCVEGGFHLGPGDEREIDARVGWLADQGVVYITLAHLFYRGVATNAPAIPMLTAPEYETLFHEPGLGLTPLGEAAVRAMYRHKVLIDISHMSQEAIDDTFRLVEKLDDENGAKPRDYPLLATHVGMRRVGPNDQSYNLSAATAKRIHARGGLIGLITAQHQIGRTWTRRGARKAVRRHMEAIRDACGNHEATALGTDIDGFIKPTLKGFETAADYAVVAEWVEQDQGADAKAILHDNARGVLERLFTARDAARSRP